MYLSYTILTEYGEGWGRRGGVPSVVQLLSYECGLCQPPSPVMERDPHPLRGCALCMALQEPGCNACVQRLPLGFGRMSKFFPLPPSFLELEHSPSPCSLLTSTLHPPPSPPPRLLPPPLQPALHPHPSPGLHTLPLHPASPSLPHPSLHSPHFPTPTAAPPPPSSLYPPIPEAISSLPVCSLLSSLQAPPLAKMTVQLFSVGVVSPFCALFAQLLRL